MLKKYMIKITFKNKCNKWKEDLLYNNKLLYKNNLKCLIKKNLWKISKIKLNNIRKLKQKRKNNVID